METLQEQQEKEVEEVKTNSEKDVSVSYSLPLHLSFDSSPQPLASLSQGQIIDKKDNIISLSSSTPEQINYDMPNLQDELPSDSIILSDTDTFADLNHEEYMALDKGGRALVDDYLFNGGHPFPVRRFPCGGYNWFNAIPVGSHVLNNIYRHTWILSDAMVLLAGTVSASSPSICVLTSIPTHPPGSVVKSADKYSGFVDSAMREIRVVHNNLPATGRTPPLITVPLNINNLHWILLLAFPSLGVVEVMDSASNGEPSPYLAEAEFWIPAFQLLCKKMVGWNDIDSSLQWTLSPTSRIAPGQTNGIDCGRFCIWYMWSLEFVSRFLDTEEWERHKTSSTVQ